MVLSDQRAYRLARELLPLDFNASHPLASLLHLHSLAAAVRYAVRYLSAREHVEGEAPFAAGGRLVLFAPSSPVCAVALRLLFDFHAVIGFADETLSAEAVKELEEAVVDTALPTINLSTERRTLELVSAKSYDASAAAADVLVLPDPETRAQAGESVERMAPGGLVVALSKPLSSSYLRALPSPPQHASRGLEGVYLYERTQIPSSRGPILDVDLGQESPALTSPHDAALMQRKRRSFKSELPEDVVAEDEAF
uniref:Uncharacterized protein n=1 Tax=Rhizochromulina marina TaxID=1034831 RepID=A0A7S2SS95_9STRA